jgi:uncharacterized protein DUF5678
LSTPEHREPEQAELDPHDLSNFDGEWVAVRDGKVVAHSPDEETLRADPNVRDGDDIYPVGDPPSGFYMINV